VYLDSTRARAWKQVGFIHATGLTSWPPPTAVSTRWPGRFAACSPFDPDRLTAPEGWTVPPGGERFPPSLRPLPSARLLAVERYPHDDLPRPAQASPRSSCWPRPRVCAFRLPGWPALGSGGLRSGWPAAGRGKRRELLGELKGWPCRSPLAAISTPCGASTTGSFGVADLGRPPLPGPEKQTALREPAAGRFGMNSGQHQAPGAYFRAFGFRAVGRAVGQWASRLVLRVFLGRAGLRWRADCQEGFAAMPCNPDPAPDQSFRFCAKRVSFAPTLLAEGLGEPDCGSRGCDLVRWFLTAVLASDHRLAVL